MKYKIWLIMLNLSGEIIEKLLDLYKDEKAIYDKFEEIIKNEHFKFKKLNNLNKVYELEKAEKIEIWMRDNNVGLITFNNSYYPAKLREIQGFPYALFYKGNIEILKEKIVGIVGSRKCSSYGIEVARLLTKELISYNITIISGGAKGIDSVCHNTAISEKGKTIVVLGCGIDIAYPSQNKCLFNDVVKDGLIISEFLPGTRPLSFNFPRRNRIISGLSDLIIVVEASEKSGSLITANYAIEQNKDVLVVPGSVFSKGSMGCNKLIRDGALIFTCMEDLRCILNLTCKEKARILSVLQQKILSVVSDGPIHIDEIVRKSNVDREALYNVLFEMQNRKEIISLPGNYYAKII
ncbi:MAG: DNA-processing protein DprA [Clostridiaceae bacterium]|nr:DNA-processing protein DprA [Clostridiaceae bacterium]